MPYPEILYDEMGHPIPQYYDGTDWQPWDGGNKGGTLAAANVQAVTTAGVRVQLPDVPCREIMITALRANGGYIYIGGATVSSSVYGVELAKLDSVSIPVSNTNQIYIDSSVNLEGISYIAVL